MVSRTLIRPAIDETESYAVPFRLAAVCSDTAAALVLSPAFGGSEPVTRLDNPVPGGDLEANDQSAC
ncbi:hypothetical protein RM533_12805, partial [Croceicoccus sp. F390]